MSNTANEPRNDATHTDRLLDCGWCYEENGEEVHPHPKCPIVGVARYHLRADKVQAVQWTGSNEAELRAFAGQDFDTIDPEDRIEDGDQDAQVLVEASYWTGISPGYWVLKFVDHFDVERDEAFRAAYEPAVVPSAPVDRAAVLAEAADAPAAECSAQNRNYESGPRLCIRAAQHHGDHIDEHGFHWSDTVAVYPVDDGTFRRGTDVRAALRRRADEEQQPETQAHPPHHRWYVETLDDVADEWAPGMRFTDRAEAMARYETVSRNYPTWKDGAPVKRRFVRETTSYTVEPAAVAQPARNRLPSISTITICSSSKFYPAAKVLAEQLQRHGIRVHTPRFDFDEEQVAVSLDDKIRLTREFLNKIRHCDAVYVIDEDGYTGRSVCIEIGYAKALGRTVILAEPAVEGAVAALADAVIPVGDFPAAVVPGKEATR